MVRCAIRPERPAGGADLISCCSSLWRQTLSLRGPTPPGLCAGALRPVDGQGAPAPGRRLPWRKATLALVQRAAGAVVGAQLRAVVGCADPAFAPATRPPPARAAAEQGELDAGRAEIGRASCRERV